MFKIKDKVIEKIVIHQNYNFSTLYYYNEFTLDFKIKKAQCTYFPPDKKIPMDYYKSISSLENYKLNVMFWESSNYKLKYFTDVELINFLEEFEELDMFNDIALDESKSYFDEKFYYIDKLFKCSVEIYYENFDVERFKFRNHFPEKWIDFGNILRDLVGFDVLNIENLKYLVCDLHFDIENDGVYLSGKKLDLTRIYFYRGGIFGPFQYNFSIDFVDRNVNDCIKNYLDYSDEETFINLSDTDVERILNLIEICGVCKWYHKDYLNRLASYEFARSFFDGVHWYIELVFENMYVLHLGGHSEYPDTYQYFASEIKELLGEDLFGIKKISQEDIEDYKFWENKLID